jgi:hypothetical protein
MTRLNTVRTYFIELFFKLLTSDPEFTGLSEPAELFDAAGNFDVPATPSGFVRMPSPAALHARITTASSPAQKEALERFHRVLIRVLEQLFGSLARMDAQGSADWARRLAPVIRYPDSQAYWPVNMSRLVGFDDGLLRARYYDVAGVRMLAGDLFALMFENPAVWEAPGTPKAPFESRTPFVATVGVDPSRPPYPTSPLTAGRLNLPAADARLTPGLMLPTLYAEMKSLGTAVRVNQAYATTAAAGGRFQPLRHNRIHTDPLLATTRLAGTQSASFVTGSALSRGADPLMLLFHGFHPVDDGARRTGDGTGTNREFHHLAVGLLLRLTQGGELPSSEELRRVGLLFLSHSPTEARVLPLSHPSLRFLDDAGEESSEGTHPVVIANRLKIQGYGSGGNDDESPLADGANDALDYDPTDGEWWVGLGSAVALGAAAGSPAGPIGAAIGAAIGLLVYLLAWLLKELFGGDEDRQQEWTEQEPWPGDTGAQSYQQSASHDIGPSGTTAETGGAKPGRSYVLEMIPHFPDSNLYGLSFAGADTFRIVDDAGLREMLAWRAFDGGIGYQFDRPMPGRAEAAGSSLCNYFDLFARKLQDLGRAQADVVYFDD